MAAMTNKERIMALISGEKPDRVPIYPFAMGFPVVYTKTSIADAYNKPAVAFAAQIKMRRRFRLDLHAPNLLRVVRRLGVRGRNSVAAWRIRPGRPKVLKRMAETPEEAMRLTVPENVAEAGIVPIQKQFFELCLKEDADNMPWKIVFQLEGTFNMANNMVGTTNLQKWCIKKKDAAHHVMRMAVEYQKKLLDYWKATFGTAGVLPWGGEPSGSNQLISPRTFEEFAFPYIKEVHEYALSLGYKGIFKHICGEQNRNLPVLVANSHGRSGFLEFRPRG